MLRVSTQKIGGREEMLSYTLWKRKKGMELDTSYRPEQGTDENIYLLHDNPVSEKLHS